MQIWFLTQWLGYSDSRPTPLWRHPEVSLLDWLCQLLMPLLLPLSNRRATAEAFVVRSLEMRGSSLRIARCMMYALMPTNVRLIMRSTSKAADMGMLRRQLAGAPSPPAPKSAWSALFILREVIR